MLRLGMVTRLVVSWNPDWIEREESSAFHGDIGIIVRPSSDHHIVVSVFVISKGWVEVDVLTILHLSVLLLCAPWFTIWGIFHYSLNFAVADLPACGRDPSF